MAFTHDVFLSYSSKDLVVVQDLAARLRSGGLRVWFDQWEIGIGDSIPSKIESGLEGSAVLVLCMSTNAFGSDWTALESQTFRFRDPLNRERRFIPLRLDDADLPGSLPQFRYADWRSGPDQVVEELVELCRPRSRGVSPEPPTTPTPAARQISLGHTESIVMVAYSPDGTHALTGSDDHTARLWDLATGQCTRILEGHNYEVYAVAYSPDGTHALTGSRDSTVRLWDLTTGQPTHTLNGHTSTVTAVAFSPDGTHALSGSWDSDARLWDLTTGQPTHTLKGHAETVGAVAYSPDGTRALTGSWDDTARLWDLTTGQCIRILEGHSNSVWAVVYSPDGTHALTGSTDHTARLWDLATGKCTRTLEGHTKQVYGVAFSPDGTHALTCSSDHTVGLWDLTGGQRSRVFQGHTHEVLTVAYSPDGTHALSGSRDSTALLWDVTTGQPTHLVEGHTEPVRAAAFSPDGTHALTGSGDNTARLWNVATGECTRILQGHTDAVTTVAYSPDGTHALTGSDDNTARLWNVATGECTRILQGHTNSVWAVAYSPDGTHALTGSDDNTARLWNVATGECTRILQGHTNSVWAVAYGPDGAHALTGSADQTARLWDLTTSRCTRILEGHTGDVRTVAYSPHGDQAVTGSADHTARVWDLGTGRCTRILEGHTTMLVGVGWPGGEPSTVAANGVLRRWAPDAGRAAEEAGRYTNAKVLLVGDSGAGKSGLATRLVEGRWEHTESTLGAWATQLPLPHTGPAEADEQREVWLWDFGGQADQQLIHQLYMRDAALTVLVFDGQRDDAMPRLWALTRGLDAGGGDIPRLLVAGRTDMHPVRSSDDDIEAFRTEAGYLAYLATSARTGANCEKLREAIVGSIDWSKVPRHSTPKVFQAIRSAILRLRDQGRVLIAAKDLRDRLPLDIGPFTAEQLDAVIDLLAGPGAVMTLGFGDWVLLRPGLLNAYAQAVIHTMRADPRELGCIAEDRLLRGDLVYPPDFERLDVGDEAIVLRAMRDQMVDQELCFHDVDRGSQLIFPSYFRRDRPDRPTSPTPLVTYRFQGMLEAVYASLVARLHRSDSFESTDLWRNAADFTGPTEATIGIRLTPVDHAHGELDIYYDGEAPPLGDQVLFARHVDEHLRQNTSDLVRHRIYRCPSCGIAPAEDAVERRRGDGMEFIRCNACAAEPKIEFLDELERRFTDPEIVTQVALERHAADTELDNESRERRLVGQAYTTVAAAGQIAREITAGDWGLDMEVEFKDDEGNPTGRRVWLQLRSGDSPIRREFGDTRSFPIDTSHAVYWADHPDPVYLVIQTGDGRIEAMDARATLRALRDAGAWPTARIPLGGEPFDVMCVRRWRQKALGLPRP